VRGDAALLARRSARAHSSLLVRILHRLLQVTH
jgi:hypothetical protein